MTVDSEPWADIESFDQTTYEQWRANVDKVLSRRRGDLTAEQLATLFTKVLTTRTDDDIVLQPLYRAEDSPAAVGLPGQAPFVRGASASGAARSGWGVRQRVTLRPSAAATNAAVLNELENGSTSIWLDLDGRAPSADQLDAVLDGVQQHDVPLTLAPGPVATEAAEVLLELWRARDLPADLVRGNLGFDPIGRFAISGGVEDSEIGLATAAEVARVVARDFPAVATFVVDGSIYHNAGASEADELALALATGTAYLRTLITAGLDMDAAASTQIDFRLAAADNQFLTIAKLRAARRLWARVTEVAGASPDARTHFQHAVTSRAMLTRYDPWVNLLRTTVAGFAAGVGGADAVTIDPHDVLLGADASDDGLSARLARNVSMILMEESNLARVVDPAGGSWFVEKLTDDLAQRAWKRFQRIEAAGGLAAALEAGLPQGWLVDTRARREQRIAHRRQPITGVSEFPNLADEAPALPEPAARSTPFQPVTSHTYAETFERLRDRAAAARSATGTAPTVFLASLGPLAEHTARATFVTNLFAAGGLAVTSPGTVTAADVAESFRASGADLACICGSNDRYAAEAVDVAVALAAAAPARLYLAGDPGGLRGDLDRAGVEEYVVLGGDAVTLLDRALTTAGVQ